ncbi:helix-turn-helix transcriptional regulator [Burkholderia anthina]|uniref:helix-turn-helix transcriptional regulator n=1 Tax=Burkholderia anthina TaxID=179879 RepID=UPI001FC82413|nr:AlpA family phage regulatory protein [Burkholderia anthina]
MTQKLQGPARPHSGTRYFSVSTEARPVLDADSTPTTTEGLVLPTPAAKSRSYPQIRTSLSDPPGLTASQPDKVMRILRMKQLIGRTNLSRATLYVLMSSDPTFPKRIKLTARSIGFLESEVDAWISARAESRNAA